MHPWFAKMVELVKDTPPACLGGFRVSPAHAETWNNCAGWALMCPCGGSNGNVLGYPLEGCDPGYQGPPVFVSPLAFLCSTCGKTTELLDTSLHGYDAENQKAVGTISNSHYRGRGERTPIPCPQCGATGFSVKALCAHSHFDLIEDHPELERHVQEYFDWFTCEGLCACCGKTSSLADFELG